MNQRLYWDSIEHGIMQERNRIIELINDLHLEAKESTDFLADPKEQKEFEIYEKGFNAGVQVERERILELINLKENENG